ncbi:MAG: MFS transporter, partial [Rubrivivax sp.]|nr:MFS transporter [Rubrivivax sp.]
MGAQGAGVRQQVGRHAAGAGALDLPAERLRRHRQAAGRAAAQRRAAVRRTAAAGRLVRQPEGRRQVPGPDRAAAARAWPHRVLARRAVARAAPGRLAGALGRGPVPPAHAARPDGRGRRLRGPGRPVRQGRPAHRGAEGAGSRLHQGHAGQGRAGRRAWQVPRRHGQGRGRRPAGPGLGRQPPPGGGHRARGRQHLHHRPGAGRQRPGRQGPGADEGRAGRPAGRPRPGAAAVRAGAAPGGPHARGAGAAQGHHQPRPPGAAGAAVADGPVGAAQELSAASPRHGAAAWVVIAAGVAAALHVGKLPPAIPALQQAVGLSLVQAGFLLSMVQLAGMGAGLAVGTLADGLGLRRSLLLGLGLLALTSAAGALATGPAALMALRALEGFGFLLVVLPAPGLLRRLVPAARLARTMGLWGAYMPVATATALLAGPLAIEAVGWRGWWAALALLSLLAAGAVLRTVPLLPPLVLSTSVAAGTLHRLRDTLAAPGPWLLAACFACYAGQWLAVVGFLPT